MKECRSISIPIALYEKLKAYSKKHDLSIRKCTKKLIEEALDLDLYARKCTKTFIEETIKL